MAYFSNATEQEIYEEQYCNRCVHGGREEGCPVMNLHWQWNYQQHGDKEKAAILNGFIPREDINNLQCAMFTPHAQGA